jgi:DNA polymerase II large subunit
MIKLTINCGCNKKFNQDQLDEACEHAKSTAHVLTVHGQISAFGGLEYLHRRTIRAEQELSVSSLRTRLVKGARQ